MRVQFKLASGSRPSDEQEKEFFAAQGFPQTTLNTILDNANRSNNAFVKRLLLGDAGAVLQAELADICIVPAKVVFLPPMEQEIQFGDGEGAWEDAKFDETRLAKVLDFLRSNEIKLDQTIIDNMPNPPADLNKSIINNWTRQDESGEWDIASAREDSLNAVMEFLKTQPNAFKLDEEITVLYNFDDQYVKIRMARFQVDAANDDQGLQEISA